MFESYIGTKRIDAEPMTRGEYAKLSGRNSIMTEKGESETDEGYRVRYGDGYESWSPKAVFETAYKKSGEMNFGHAIELLKLGCKMARKGWNGKSQYVELATNISYKNANGEIINCEHEAIGNKALAFVGTSGVQIGWLASQADMLAEDWHIVE